MLSCEEEEAIYSEEEEEESLSCSEGRRSI
jgi:hypothetical protein